MTKKKIVVLEDQVGVQMVYANYLSDYHTYLFGTAGEALEQLKIVKPDLVIVDINLPDMDGFDFISVVRKEMGLAVDIVVISGGVDMGYSVKAMEYGISQILSKPLTKEELLECVKRHVDKKDAA